MDILYLSPADWDGPRGRFQHVARRFAGNNRVLYADGLGVRKIGLPDWRRSLRKIGQSLRPVPRRPPGAQGLWRVTPVAVPGQRHGLARAANRSILRAFLRYHLRALRFEEPLVWIAYPHPTLVSLLDGLSPRAVVYDRVDDWPMFARAFGNIADAEERLMARADLVLVTAAALLEKASRFNERAFLVPNGVDVESFAGVPNGRGGEPRDVAALRRPRIGFVGNIAEWVDLGLVERVARMRSEWDFVFVGHYQAQQPRPRAGNIHWLGYRPYESIPAYLRAFDVCIMPFVDSELTRSADPLKLYEYLAAGKPVVSTPLPRVADFGDLVCVASGADAFAAAIAATLSGDDAERARRVAAARLHTWSSRVAEMASLVRTHLAIELEER
jgi:glycosyltransferase involved in cell wall biosynthesis